jgi:hypothetical protein
MHWKVPKVLSFHEAVVILRQEEEFTQADIEQEVLPWIVSISLPPFFSSGRAGFSFL